MRWNQAPKWAYSCTLNIKQVMDEKFKCEMIRWLVVLVLNSLFCRMPGCKKPLADAGVTLRPATVLSHVCQYLDDGAFPDLLATQLLWSWFVPEQPLQPIAKISFPLLWWAASCFWMILDPSSVSMKKCRAKSRGDPELEAHWNYNRLHWWVRKHDEFVRQCLQAMETQVCQCFIAHCHLQWKGSRGWGWERGEKLVNYNFFKNVLFYQDLMNPELHTSSHSSASLCPCHMCIVSSCIT